MKPFQVGDFSVSSIIEREGPIRAPAVMFPTSDPQAAARHLSEIGTNTWSPTSGMLFNTYQTFVLRRGGEVILIDTCVGEDKARPPHFNYSKQPWLDGFARQKLGFDEVDVVINTHLHVEPRAAGRGRCGAGRRHQAHPDPGTHSGSFLRRDRIPRREGDLRRRSDAPSAAVPRAGMEQLLLRRPAVRDGGAFRWQFLGE